MDKILGEVFVGVFNVVLAVKLVEKCSPNWLNNAKDKVNDGMKAAKDAFNEGRASSAQQA